MTPPDDKPGARELDLKSAAQVIEDYQKPNVFWIDNGNLFFAATEYQSAYEAVCKQRDELIKKCIMYRDAQEHVSHKMGSINLQVEQERDQLKKDNEALWNTKEERQYIIARLEKELAEARAEIEYWKNNELHRK